MPSKSKKQQRFFGMVHAYQKGELKNASASVKKAAKSISYDDARAFAKTKHKGLPTKVRKKKLNEIKIITFTQMINELYSKLNEGYYDDINGWISTSQNNSGFKDNDQVQTSDGKYKGTVYDVMVSPDKKDICVVVKWTNGTVTKYGRMDRNKELGKDWGDITTIKKLNESKILTFNDIIES